MSRGSLRWRLLLAAGISSLLAVLIAAALLTLLFERHVSQSIGNELNVHLDQLIAGLGRSPDGEIAVLRQPTDSRFRQPLSGLYWQVRVEPDGPVYRSRSLWDFELDLPRADPQNAELGELSLPGPGGSTLHVLQRHVALPRTMNGGEVDVAVALDAAELRGATRRFAGILIPSLLLIGLLLGAAAFAQVTIGLRPLKTLRTRLGAIRVGQTDRLGDTFPDEVQPLATEIDNLLESRAEQVEKARRRAADLAHGLKTSLQVLTGEVRSLREKGETEAAKTIELLADAMQGHVERQLAQARLAPKTGTACADIAQVVATVRRVMERTPRGAELTWSEKIQDGLAARIDSQDLAEALGNLLENAARHTKSEVTVTAKAEADQAILTIADDGPGIPEDRFESVLRRGERLDQSGEGAGLGLAIVADIADAWGGEVRLADNRPGLVVHLILPLAGSGSPNL